MSSFLPEGGCYELLTVIGNSRTQLHPHCGALSSLGGLVVTVGFCGFPVPSMGRSHSQEAIACSSGLMDKPRNTNYEISKCQQ